MLTAPADLTVISLRGGAFETAHPVAAVLVQNGAARARVGALGSTTWRSAAKPFQLEGSLSLLPADAVEVLSEEDLAVGASSHSAQPPHVARVRDLLSRLGAHEAWLRCGAHEPVHAPSARALAKVGPATPIHNNCSGKHAFMCAAAAALGLAGSDYREPEHPIQRRIRDLLDDYTSGLIESVVVDGCSAPCFVLGLEGMARAWSRLAEAVRDGQGRLGRIGAAMAAHPWWTSGDDRIEPALAAHATAPIISKVGAQGLLCIALPSQGAGIALKALTGDGAARAVAARAVLERWFPGLVPEVAIDPWRVVRSCLDVEVGERSARWA